MGVKKTATLLHKLHTSVYSSSLSHAILPLTSVAVVFFSPVSLLQSIRQHLALRGPAGFISLSKCLSRASSLRPSDPRFQLHADEGSFLSLANLKRVLSDLGCKIQGKDVTRIFTHLDFTGRGEVHACPRKAASFSCLVYYPKPFNCPS